MSIHLRRFAPDRRTMEAVEMIRRIRIWTLIALVALGTACAPSEETVEPEVTTPKAVPKPLPPVSVLIGHRVADFDAWMTVFDEHMPTRKEAGCLGHYLKRGVDDRDMVYVYCLATDVDRLRAFLESDDLGDAMQRAGVQGEPMITLMQPMSRNLVSGRLLPGIIVMHEVQEYDEWRVFYDEFDDYRRANGIVGHAVSRDYDDPNQVIRAFVESTELKETMERAGVVGEPDVRFIRVVGYADY
jgi:quinol monooxygenase YgiN